MMTRARSIVAGVTILVAALGLFAGWLFDSEIFGAVTGILIGLPLGQAVMTKRCRWLAVVVLNILFVLSFIVSGWWVSVYALAVSALTFFISAAILRSLYGGSEFEALAHQLKVAIGLTKGFQIVDEGKTIFPKNSTSPMGPHIIIVRPDNAVILERGSRRTRLSGPDFIQSSPFEYVKRIYDLRQKQVSMTLSNVLTSDLMTTTVEISITYGIDVPAEARRGERPLTRAERDRIQWIDSHMSDWDQETKDTVEGSIRRVVGSWNLDTLLAPGTLDRLESQVLALANRKVSSWGIQIRQVAIKSVQPERKVTEASTNLRLADVEAALMDRIERARAFAWRDALITLADGYQQAVKLGMSESAIHRELLRRMLEQISKDPATKLILTPELGSTLMGLRRSAGLSP